MVGIADYPRSDIDYIYSMIGKRLNMYINFSSLHADRINVLVFGNDGCNVRKSMQIFDILGFIISVPPVSAVL